MCDVNVIFDDYLQGKATIIDLVMYFNIHLGNEAQGELLSRALNELSPDRFNMFLFEINPRKVGSDFFFPSIMLYNLRDDRSCAPYNYHSALLNRKEAGFTSLEISVAFEEIDDLVIEVLRMAYFKFEFKVTITDSRGRFNEHNLITKMLQHIVEQRSSLREMSKKRRELLENNNEQRKIIKSVSIRRKQNVVKEDDQGALESKMNKLCIN